MNMTISISNLRFYNYVALHFICLTIHIFAKFVCQSNLKMLFYIFGHCQQVIIILTMTKDIEQ